MIRRTTLLPVSFAPCGKSVSPSSSALSVLHSAIWSRYANSSNDLTLRAISDLRNRQSHDGTSSFSSSLSSLLRSFSRSNETIRKSRRWHWFPWLMDFPARWKLALIKVAKFARCQREGHPNEWVTWSENSQVILEQHARCLSHVCNEFVIRVSVDCLIWGSRTGSRAVSFNPTHNRASRLRRCHPRELLRLLLIVASI